MIILASASPRRRELMEKYISKEFKVIPANTAESTPDSIPAEEVAEYLAVQKAQAVCAENPYDDVIGADTVVLLDGKILGKPRNINHAREMLSMLSGRIHTVITGVCVCTRGKVQSFSEQTRVEFYPLTENEIEKYIKTGDPMDKAGAYGIQSEGCLLVKGINGDFFNVVGLPVARLSRVLKELSVQS